MRKEFLIHGLTLKTFMYMIQQKNVLCQNSAINENE